MNDYVSTLISAGADAMNNMFEVDFTLPVSNTADQNARLKVRAEGFTPPTASQTTYPVHWKTVSLDRPATKISLERTFSITFRLDAYYLVYQALLQWHKVTMHASKGFASNDLSGLGEVTVKALDTPVVDVGGVDEDSDIDKTDVTWNFKDVWIESLTPPTYSTSSAEPSKVTAKFRFGQFTDPQDTL